MQFKVLKEEILKYLQYANSFTNPKGLNDISRKRRQGYCKL